ncbi:hypothetical protein [Paracoccus sp. MKU1]|uniref:hypothetical protein n=1 Tax=Paracoccus sp. MKU1 TaxID=1745182 RepID=UPI000AA38511|nr:hypothetical protein [Paracoccus sp. MKU1]
MAATTVYFDTFAHGMAHARPMPLLPPVMTAVFPASFMGFCFLFHSTTPTRPRRAG